MANLKQVEAGLHIDRKFILGKFESRSDRYPRIDGKHKTTPQTTPHKEKSPAISMIAKLSKIVGGLDDTCLNFVNLLCNEFAYFDLDLIAPNW